MEVHSALDLKVKEASGLQDILRYLTANN